MVIRFLKRAGIYNVNDVAGFRSPHEEKGARDYLARGVAIEVERDGEGKWVPVGASTETEPKDAGVDLEELSKEELVELATKRDMKVTRSDGKDGEPTKADYLEALSKE
jgi:hypothetical protein